MPQADLAALVNAVVDDPDVKAMVKSLAMDALTEARDMLHRGSPLVKANIIKSLMPALVASLKETSTGDGLESLRADMTALFAETRES